MAQTKQAIIDALTTRIQAMETRMAFMRTQGERMIQARYEAAQTYPTNVNHWKKADNLSPDAANRWEVRRRLMARSRFEVIENNPYLNGIVQTICNDFAGSGIRLRIKDKSIPAKRRQQIETRFSEWQNEIALREKLWEMRMDKIVSGETFAIAILNPRLENEVKLDYKVIEPDCVTDPAAGRDRLSVSYLMHVDGIKMDRLGFPEYYYVYNYHPGETYNVMLGGIDEGQWIPERHVCHWFKKMRRWSRGIPELTPSIPLCAVARRYTFALVKCMELQASLAAVLESQAPAGWVTPQGTDENGNPAAGPMFETMPIESGMFNILPYGMSMKTFDRVPVGQQYDEFIGALLREIARPLLIPFNMQIGSSKDSNMASGVLDAGIYTNAQKTERNQCAEVVLRKMTRAWYELGCLIPGYFGRHTISIHERKLPDCSFQWDKVTIEHTDPTKVMNSLETAKRAGLMSDRDIQELAFNKDIDEYRDDIEEDLRFQLKMAELQRQIDENNAATQDPTQTAAQDSADEPTTDEEDDADETN